MIYVTLKTVTTSEKGIAISQVVYTNLELQKQAMNIDLLTFIFNCL